jgi:hypothetical protein
LEKKKVDEMAIVIEKAVKDALEERYGVEVAQLRCRHSESHAKWSFETTSIEVGGKPHELHPDFTNLKYYNWQWAGATFKYKNKQYEIVGYRSRNRKRPIVMKADGDEYKATPCGIESILKQSKNVQLVDEDTARSWGDFERMERQRKEQQSNREFEATFNY